MASAMMTSSSEGTSSRYCSLRMLGRKVMRKARPAMAKMSQRSFIKEVVNAIIKRRRMKLKIIVLAFPEVWVVWFMCDVLVGWFCVCSVEQGEVYLVCCGCFFEKGFRNI